ncbi:MAG: hypothetical protein FWC76_02075 [Defluviitaleaceae bacterium]|nr:hypothetical protein [Defluviitaleaceae bacterium]
MSKLTLFLVVLLVGLSLVACGGQNVASTPMPLQSDVAVAAVTPVRDEIVSLNLQIEIADHIPAMYEPPEGAFLGAYIKRDATFDSIRAFEDDVGVAHAIFAYTMALDDEYPLRWVLENVAFSKAPFIVVNPPKDGSIYDIEPLVNFAMEAGRFHAPMFVNLFPLVDNHGFIPSEYIAFFREARGIFAEYAPNVAFVWGFDAQNMTQAAQFYPGRDVVDWVHLIIYNDVDANGGFKDFFTYINFFYFAFQQEGPLAVSVAVSHYTLENNSYFTREAAEEIEYIYGRLQDYPRIKAIIYRNYNDLQGRGNKYTINSVRDISEAYAQAVSVPHFLNYVSDIRQPEATTIRIHSPFRAIMRNSYFYIPLRALVYDARFPYLEMLEGREVEINGEMFFKIADIHRASGADFFVDMRQYLLVLR